MFKVGDYIINKREVCKIVEIKEKYFNNKDYYILVPLDDSSLKISVPIDSDSIRKLIDKEKIENIIKKIPSIEIIQIDNKMIENEYKKLMSSGIHEDLIKIIKTTYLRNKERIDNNKKIGDKDDSYFNMAEKYLYNEFSIVLGLNYEDTKKYVVEKVKEEIK